MFVYRFAKNPYKPSKWNSGANTLTGVDGTGVFAFDPTRSTLRFFGEEMFIEDTTAEGLIKQFGNFFNGELHKLDIDRDEIVSMGYGRYANLDSDNWDDYVLIPELYIRFKEF